jgi:hypothetical protein
MDDFGNLNLLRRYTGWRKTWSLIVPYFGGTLLTDLLFYDANAGEGEFYSTDGQGGINLLQRYNGWRKTWSQIREWDSNI